MKKRAISLLLAFAMVTGLFVGIKLNVSADNTVYDIWIADVNGNKVQVGSDGHPVGDVLDNGTVSYNPSTNTLTLNNYRYFGTGFLAADNTKAVISSSVNNLNINLKGGNLIIFTNDTDSYSYSYAFNLTGTNANISGDGNLEIKNTNCISVSNRCIYLKNGLLTINSNLDLTFFLW